VITQVAPARTKTWSWDGRDNYGRQVPPGTYTVELTTNNAGTFRTTFTIQAPALPDLIVEDVTYTPTSPTVGTTLTFQIRVRNIGSATAGLFYIGLSGLAGTQYASVSSLGPGAAVTVSLQLPLSASTETFTVTADATNRVTEANETNNTRQITVAAVQPPLSLSISTDKPSYTVGEAIRITITLNRPNYYVYVVELDPAGKAYPYLPELLGARPQASFGHHGSPADWHLHDPSRRTHRIGEALCLCRGSADPVLPHDLYDPKLPGSFHERRGVPEPGADLAFRECSFWELGGGFRGDHRAAFGEPAARGPLHLFAHKSSCEPMDHVRCHSLL
jgi:hypothetical protein